MDLKKNTTLDLKRVGLVSKAWEENIGTHNFANSKGLLISLRTKHIDIKHHWLHSEIHCNEIEINRIRTKNKEQIYL